MNIFQLVEENIKQILKKAEKETNTEPTQAQIEAGNYKKGRVTINGFEIAIENPKGSYRRGVDTTGRKWETKMQNTYGYFTQSKAIDGDAVDVFLGDNLKSTKVFCIDQYKGSEFDETKVMLGFNTKEESKKAYLSNYEKGWKGGKYVTEVDIDIFRLWLNNHKNIKQRKPIHSYQSLHETSSVISPYHGIIGSAKPEKNEYEIGIELDETIQEYNINNIVNNILSENKESKNLSKARNYLINVHKLEQEQAQRVLNNIRHDIPNSRVLDCKYITGIARMFMEYQLNDYRISNDLNKTLKFLEGHTDYNEDLNGLSAKEIIERFKITIQQDLDTDKNTLGQKQYTTNNSNQPYNGYTIVPINSFEEAKQYSFYTDWCITSSESAYITYTKDDLCRLYFLLKNDYKLISEKEENNPLDKYGLSMIAISVNEDGSLNTCTSRWNHDNGGNDNIMDTKQISDLIGANFYNVFKPYSEQELFEKKEKLKYFRPDNLNELFKSKNQLGDDLKVIYITELPDDFVNRVIYNGHCNYIKLDKDGDVIDYYGNRHVVLYPEYENGFTSWSKFNPVIKKVILYLDKTYNIGRSDGTLLFDNWITCDDYNTFPHMDNYGYTIFTDQTITNIMSPNEQYIFKNVIPYYIQRPRTILTTPNKYLCKFSKNKVDRSDGYKIYSKYKDITFYSDKNKFLIEGLDELIDIENINSYLDEWYNSEDGFELNENAIKNMVLDETQLSPIKQQKKDDADRADTLRDISFEEDDDNSDPEDRMEEIEEHKIDLLIDVINNKLQSPTESFLVLKYALGDTSINLSFIPHHLISKVNEAVNIIKRKATTPKSKIYIYNFVFNQVNQANMTGSQKMELRNIMSRLSNVSGTRSALAQNAMENKTYIQDLIENEIQELAPTLFKNGKDQKKKYNHHLQQMISRNYEVGGINMGDGGNVGIGGMMSEDNHRLTDRIFQLPYELYIILKNRYNQVKDNPNYTSSKNYKRLQNIIERKGEITYKWMYTLVDWRDNYSGRITGEEQDKDAWLICADKLMGWVDSELQQATESIKQSDKTTSKIGATAHTTTKFRTLESVVRDILIESGLLVEERIDWTTNIPENLSYVFDVCDESNTKNAVRPPVQSKKSKSRYYEMKTHNGYKEIIRKSNHWTYFLIPDYELNGKNYNLIFGTQDRVGRNYYSLILKNDSYRGHKLDAMVSRYINNKNVNFERGGKNFMILPRNSFGVLDRQMMCGSTIVDADDNNVMWE